jgi:hypothetical protein
MPFFLNKKNNVTTDNKIKLGKSKNKTEFSNSTGLINAEIPIGTKVSNMLLPRMLPIDN